MRWFALAVTVVAIVLLSLSGEYDEGLLLHQEMATLPLDEALAYMDGDEYKDVCVNAYAYAHYLLGQTNGGTIVLDLDETVFKGDGLNRWLGENNLKFSYQNQIEYMSSNVYPLVPGARAFMARAINQGFKLVFVTNRKPMHATVTQTHLAHYGLDVFPVIYRTGERNKQARIDGLSKVVMTIGDKDNDHVKGVSNVYTPNPLY